MTPPVDAAGWGVLLGGLALVALVVWYFFGERVSSGRVSGGRGDDARR